MSHGWTKGLESGSRFHRRKLGEWWRWKNIQTREGTEASADVQDAHEDPHVQMPRKDSEHWADPLSEGWCALYETHPGPEFQGGVILRIMITQSQ